MKFFRSEIKIKEWNTIEIMVYWLIWLIILFLPLIYLGFDDYSDRKRIIGGWTRILPFLIIFLIHNHILIPKLLFKNKPGIYIISTILIIGLINYLFIYNRYFHDLLYNLINAFDNNYEIFNDEAERIGRIGRHRGSGDGPRIPHNRPGHHKRWHRPDYLVFTYNVLISFLIVGFNATLKYTSRWLKSEQKRKEIEKENLHSQLKSLQQQVSPHFFMNTLNNIHALIDYDKENAKESVIRLSHMMRYLLYDSEKERTSLRKEIDFLISYIDLMRLRLTESVDLKVSFPEKLSDIEIYPFLFISFLENAFKYGIDPKKKTYIKVMLEILENEIHFNVKNSKPAEIPDNGDYSGIGIENTRRRLTLLFEDNYDLRIYNREFEFEVDLIVPYEN